MPQIKSKIKRTKTNAKSEAKNKSIKSEIKTCIKNTLAQTKKKDAIEIFNFAQKKIDASVTKGVYKKNTASRKKARLAKHLASLK